MASDGQRVATLGDRLETLALGFVSTTYGLEAGELSALADFKRVVNDTTRGYNAADYLKASTEVLTDDPAILSREGKVHGVWRQLGIDPERAVELIRKAWDGLDPASITTVDDLIAFEARLCRRALVECAAARAETEAQAQAERAR